MLSFHLAESREEARNQAVDGLQRWHNEYNVWTLGRPGAQHVENKWELMDMITSGGTAIIGTPDDLVKTIRHLQEITGGFGVVLGFAHDWANRENTLRSWDLVARYVIPEINQTTLGQRASMKFLNDNQATLMAGAGAAVMQKILGDERASAELGVMMQQMQAQTDDRGATFRPGGGIRDDQLPTEK
jgi:limonene 1,2-monooxygenase